MEFIGIIERLNTLAEMCMELHAAAEAADWSAKTQEDWKKATLAYKATTEAVELLGYEVDRTDNGDGTYTHTITKEEA